MMRATLARVWRKLQNSGVIQAITHWHTPCQKGSDGNVEVEKGVSAEMKKGLVAIFCLLVLTFSSLPVAAQTRYRRYDSSRYEQRVYQNRNYTGRRWDRDRWEQDRSVWDRHRDKITTGIGAGAGAVLGGAVGGKKGSVIGALLGGGGAALYTYKLRDKNRRRY